MNTLQRRTFLKGTLATGVVVAAAGTGLLNPATASAAEWPRQAFTSKTLQEVLTNLFGSADAIASNAIKIRAPTIAENGAVVPIVINAKLPSAPPLISMKQRFPDRARLRAQLADPRQFNRNTVMPPFGAHGILTREEIDQVVEFLYTL